MKKNLFRNCVIGFTFLLVAVNCAFAQNTTITEVKAVGGIATIYALDPLARTLCFEDGREGGVFQQNEARNRCSHIDFNAYNQGSLTVGIEGGENGAIIDLGTAAELQKRYGYTETVGAGQGFASLRTADGKIFILKDKGRQSPTHTEQELTEAPLLFAAGKSSANALLSWVIFIYCGSPTAMTAHSSASLNFWSFLTPPVNP
jgi:hypothetical protein